MKNEKAVREVEVIVSSIKPLLVGKGPEMQSAVLAELVSMWITGMRPDLRATAWALWLELVNDLNPTNDPWKG